MADYKKIADSFDLRGIWWFPENPENKSSGTLKFSQESGLQLFLDSSLVPNTDLFSGQNGSEKRDIINGYTEEGLYATLIYCISDSWSMTFNQVSVSKQKYKCYYLMYGGLYSSISDVSFDKVHLKIENYSGWAHQDAFHFESRKKEVFNLKYEQPPTINIALTSGLEITFGTNMSSPLSLSGIDQLKLQQEYFVSCERRERQIPFQELLDLVRVFSRLIGFSARRISNPIEIHCVEEKNEFPGVKLYYKPLVITEYVNEPRRDDYLFTLEDSKASLDTILDKWFQIEEEGSLVLNLYLSTFYEQWLFLENKFIAIFQALDTYYGKHFSTAILSKKEFKSRRIKVEKLLFDPAFRNWVNTGLRNSNFKSPHTKFVELFGEFSTLYNQFIDIGKTSGLATRIRNAYSHPSKTKQDEISPQLMYDSIVILRTLLEAWLLLDLGFTKEYITEKMVPILRRFIGNENFND